MKSSYWGSSWKQKFLKITQWSSRCCNVNPYAFTSKLQISLFISLFFQPVKKPYEDIKEKTFQFHLVTIMLSLPNMKDRWKTSTKKQRISENRCAFTKTKDVTSNKNSSHLACSLILDKINYATLWLLQWCVNIEDHESFETIVSPNNFFSPFKSTLNLSYLDSSLSRLLAIFHRQCKSQIKPIQRSNFDTSLTKYFQMKVNNFSLSKVQILLVFRIVFPLRKHTIS